MFDHTHYVPILRWKRAEWTALRNLHNTDAARMTPLIELVPKKVSAPPRSGKTVSVGERLYQTAEDVLENWGQDPFFVDLWLLPPQLLSENGEHPLEVLGKSARSFQLSLIPVTGLNRTAVYQAAVASLVKTDCQGVCIRLLRKDIRHPRFRSNLKDLLTCLSIRPDQVDLLVDCQIIDEGGVSLTSLCTRLPNLSLWRTFTFASGAFPKDLAGFTVGQHLHPRLDWLTWYNQAITTPILPRSPTYSDYTIQHPIFSEPPPRANFSASIRYTTDEHWVIMRGEGVFHDGSPGFAQWPANAQLLCEREEFCGASFSYGDEYIEEKSLQPEPPGNAMTWLRAGVNHHMTFVVHQIASLFDTSTVGTP